jgi:hypothetical protein
VITGDFEPVAPVLVGGADPRRRLAIHRRHYKTSLARALRDKFPATAWLVGPDLIAAAASTYVQAHPPCRPCIAEYGADFPAFLANDHRAQRFPYLESFAELEWAVGQVSIAIDYPPATWSEVSRVGADALVDSGVALQPGLRYLRCSWGVDALMKMYLSDTASETFALPETDTCIEVRGARGDLQIRRIDSAAFEFRAALNAGRSIGDAAGAALACCELFDAGAALHQLVDAGLAIGMTTAAKGDEP